MFVENCSGHYITMESQSALSDINTNLRYLHANATGLFQPKDSFIIQVFKREWHKKCDEPKVRMCIEHSTSKVSGKVKHSSRVWYMQKAV